VLNPDFAVEILSWRLKAAGPARNMSLAGHATEGGNLMAARSGSRPVYFAEYGETVETPVFEHGRLSQGTTLRGPAIIEQRETTTVVGPDDSIFVDELGSLLIALREQQ
jgi:N-methylhydantoinase A/oxoprolinase/acetone carboxylase beta subunit